MSVDEGTRKEHPCLLQLCKDTFPSREEDALQTINGKTSVALSFQFFLTQNFHLFPDLAENYFSLTDHSPSCGKHALMSHTCAILN